MANSVEGMRNPIWSRFKSAMTKLHLAVVQSSARLFVTVDEP